MLLMVENWCRVTKRTSSILMGEILCKGLGDLLKEIFKVAS